MFLEQKLDLTLHMSHSSQVLMYLFLRKSENLRILYLQREQKFSIVLFLCKWSNLIVLWNTQKLFLQEKNLLYIIYKEQS